jgi:hypothetical protein
VLLALFTCTVGAYTVGTIEATLSPFLDTMDISVKLIAVAFLVMSLCSVLATPIFGFICDSKVTMKPKFVIPISLFSSNV